MASCRRVAESARRGAHHVPALRHRLGLGGQHALSVDQAGGQPLRRHAQRHGAALTQGHQDQGRGAQPVSSRGRRGPHCAQSGKTAAAQGSERHQAAVHGWRLDAVFGRQRQGCRPAQDPVLREMFGNRGIYHEGWMASTRRSIPWDMAAKILALKDDLWERYDVRNDFSQADNLAGKYPDKLKELQKVFDKEAIRNNVFPIDDRRAERLNPTTARSSPRGKFPRPSPSRSLRMKARTWGSTARPTCPTTTSRATTLSPARSTGSRWRLSRTKWRVGRVSRGFLHSNISIH